MYSLAPTLSLLPLLAGPALAILDGIDARDVYEEMEHIYVDNSGTNSDGFIGAVTPCSNYFQDKTGIEGEQSSAQWVRIVFHDFVTANITEGTGGLDGSVAYEADRPENPGLFINDTLGFMFPTITAYLSMADNIALGIVAAVSTCTGSSEGVDAIALRTGRVDALEAGPFGVPEPTTDLETTLNQFAAAGFNQSDAIAVTACGHSLGRIHYSNFPTIVDESIVTSNNTHGGIGFDTTPAAFDNSVITEYLEGTGNKGGLLVTAPSEEDRSDLRLYQSDDNETISALAEDLAFRQTCFSLFERMIDTVPAGVELSDPVVPMTWKAVDVAQDVSSSGAVSISGMFRYLYTSGTPNTTVPFTVTTSNGTTTDKTSGTKAGNGTSLFGTTYYWNFNTTIESGTTALAIGDVSYPINDDLFILPEQSKATGNGGQRGNATIRAAVRTELVADDVTAVLYVPKQVTGTRGVVINVQNSTMNAVGTAGDYTIFQTNATGSFSTGSGVIMKVVSGESASRTIKIDLFNTA